MSSGNDKEIRIGVTAETSGAEEARKALEGVKRAAEEAAAAQGAVGSGSGSPEGAGGARVDAKAIEEVTEATLEQVEANGVLIDSLDELTDAEAGVVRSTGKVSDEFKKLSEEAKKPEGFAKLYSKERLEGIKSSFGELGKAVGDFAKEFAKTEEGQKLLEGLPEELKVFGESALAVGDSVAKGFAAGGPIGGAVSGLAALVQHVGKEYLDAQERIAASNRELEEAEAAAAERREERRKEATSREIERTLEAEKRLLDDQNASIQTQTGLWNARKENAKADLEQRRAEAELRGEDTSKFDREKIDMNFQHEMYDLKGERDRLLGAKAQASHDYDVKKAAAEKEAASSGRNEEPAKKAQEAADEAAQKLADIERDLPRQLETIQYKESAANHRHKADLAGFGKDQRDRGLEEQRRQQAEEKRRSDESTRRRRAGEREATEGEIERRTDGLNHSAMDSAGAFAKAAGAGRGRFPQASAGLDGIGKRLADGTNEKELKELAAQFDKIAQGSANETLKALRSMLSSQMKQAEEIRKLQGELKKGVPHG